MINHSILWTGLFSLLLASSNAVAGDRPYVATSTAAAEEDDDAVWSVGSWHQRTGSVRATTVAAEYAFSPTTSIQFEATRTRDREFDTAEREMEIEFKHLFNHIARDGWGWGISTSLQLEKLQSTRWKTAALALNVPFSVSLWEGDGLLHLNGGVVKPSAEKMKWTASLAVERKIARNVQLFAELARQGDKNVAHTGVRYWVKREKIAMDISISRFFELGQSSNGVTIGFNIFDL